jgi:hypothetical protein
MTDDYFPQMDPSSEATPRRRLGRIPKVALTAGLAVGLAAGGATLAFAAGSSTTTPGSSASSATTLPSALTPNGHGKHGLGFGRLRGPLGLGKLGGGFGRDIVHGQITIRSGNGYKTVEIQSGTVSSVNSTSITVTSSDGYVHTYAVTPSTLVDSQAGGISSLSGKDDIVIVSSQVGGKDTATNIVDLTKIKASRKGFGFAPPPGQNDSNGTTGTPSGAGDSGSAAAALQ